jgi:uncharacterized protein involved in exopolysaccharide biosynthesis
MPESPEFLQYVAHLRRRWAVIVLACAVALGLAGVITSLQTKQFTARALVLIRPPASDSFPATALSPTYMESLRTYEHLARGDSLFQKAVSELQITLPPGSDSVLDINVLRQTRVLEVTATLPDPQQAQTLAQYIAAAVVRMSGSPADATANAGINSRTETLELVDPGVVPERPSSPRLWFNLLAAFFTAFVLSLFYLSFEFGLKLRKAETLRKSLRVASHG